MTATFTYFGEELEYAPDFPAFEYAEFHAARLDGDDVLEADAQGYLMRLAVACVAEKDRPRFRKLSRQNRAKLQDWSAVVRDWTAEAAERPTGQPTDSSAGPSTTPASSESEPVASVTPIGMAEPARPVMGTAALAAARSRAV